MEEKELSTTHENEKTVNIIGGEIDKSTVSLRFFGDNLCVEEVTQLLNCSPSMAYQKGDFLNNQIAKKGAWLLQVKKSKKSLEHQISELLNQLSEDLEVWQELTTKYKADLFCGLWLNGWNRGTDFSAKILKQISERGLKLDLDIYCMDDEN